MHDINDTEVDSVMDDNFNEINDESLGVERLFTYCDVKPKGMNRTFYYISGPFSPEVGDIVEIPFGYNNKVVLGIVEGIEVYTESDTPYPVEKTKEILDIRYDLDSIDDYDEYDDIDDIDDVDIDDDDIKCIKNSVKNLEKYIGNEDWEAVLEWAYLNHDVTNGRFIMVYVGLAYKECIKHRYNIAEAATNLGALYYSGIAFEQDYVKAAYYYKMAAELGNIRAICNMGYCYYYGRHQEKDYKLAFDYFVRGGLLGDPNCLYKLGDMYLNGEHVDVNKDMAFKLYQRALKINNEWDYNDDLNEDEINADILMRLGRCYLEGIGVSPNYNIALKNLCNALQLFYERKITDPFAESLIKRCTKLIAKCQENLDKEFYIID